MRVVPKEWERIAHTHSDSLDGRLRRKLAATQLMDVLKKESRREKRVILSTTSQLEHTVTAQELPSPDAEQLSGISL